MYIAIAGCPRSGTSALCNLLMQDERILLFDEIQAFVSWDTGSVVSGRLRKWLSKKGNNFRHLLKISGLDPDAFLNFVSSNGGVSGRELCDYVMNNSNAIMFGDKGPESYIKAANTMADKFPDMKFVFAQRDGRAVIASHIRTWRTSNTDVNHLSKIWIRNTSAILKLKKAMPDRCKIIMYEESVLNPEPMIEELSEFLELDPVIVNGINFKNIPYYRSVNLDTWKQEIPHMLDEIRDPKFKKLMSLYGYI